MKNLISLGQYTQVIVKNKKIYVIRDGYYDNYHSESEDFGEDINENVIFLLNHYWNNQKYKGYIWKNQNHLSVAGWAVKQNVINKGVSFGCRKYSRRKLYKLTKFLIEAGIEGLTLPKLNFIQRLFIF